MEQHFTAWVSISPHYLEGDNCDVVILRDEIAGYRTDDDGTETPDWTSTGDEEFKTELPIRHEDIDITEDVLPIAQTTLTESGWDVEGDWNDWDGGFIATVSRSE